MIEEIVKGKIYRNIITLPNTPLRALHSYIIISDDDVLVIDTGFNLDSCYEEFVGGLTELGIKLEQIDLLATHLHSDHCGLFGRLDGKIKSFSIGRKDAVAIDLMFLQDYFKSGRDKAYQRLDLVRYNLSMADDPVYAYMYNQKLKYNLLDEGDTIKVGSEFSFKVIDTPGHTPGHIVLYDDVNKIMVTGDHVLGRISPNIAFWGFEYGDILGQYMQNLMKVRNYNVDYMLTSHRDAPPSLSGRVDELLSHHFERLEEIKDILRSDGEQTVSTVTSKMKWSIRANSWEEFPNAQKWFASGEVMAHLEHLRATGYCDLRMLDEMYYYKLREGS